MRSTRIYPVLFLASFLFNGCKKDSDLRDRFVAGEVVVTLADSSTINNTFNLINSLNLKIKELDEFEFTTAIGQDSVQIILDILNSKTYLHNSGRTFGTLYRDNTLTMSLDFFNLNTDQVSNWDSTVTNLNLIENFQAIFSKWGVISVPVGQEQFWADELNKQ